jgi:hypothetical protein
MTGVASSDRSGAYDWSRDVDRSRAYDWSCIFRPESDIQRESHLSTGVGHTTGVPHTTGVTSFDWSRAYDRSREIPAL